MDFKALRAKRNDKARSLIESSGGKVDSSDWTPSEMLDADAKTGMRPISRRAFKVGGKVEGEEAKTNLSRAPRGNIGLANTNQRVANEERDGTKHVGGFKKGGRTGYQDAGFVSGEELGEASEPTTGFNTRDKNQEARGQAALDWQNKHDKAEEGRQALRDMGDKTRRASGGRTAKAGGGSFKEAFATARKELGAGKTFDWKGKSYTTNYAEEENTKPAMNGKSAATGRAKELYEANLKAVTDPNGRKESLGLDNKINDAKNMATAKGMGLKDIPRPPPSNRVAPVDMPTSKGIPPNEPITVEPLKRGGMAKKKYEGSPKDNLMDARMAKKKGMTHAEWEKSPEDKRMDAKGQREMNARTGKMDGGSMVADDEPKKGPYQIIHQKSGKVVGKANTLKGARNSRERNDMKYGSYAHQILDTATGKTTLKNGGAAHGKDCACKACGGSAGYKDGGRMARATGGRAGKGKTNIVINVMPHSANKPAAGIQPPMPPMPMPPVSAPPPMGAMPPPRMSLPPGLGAAMAGAAGTGPMPPAAPPPMMGRKDGGKVYPKMRFGAGSGEGRLEKIKEYGKNA